MKTIRKLKWMFFLFLVGWTCFANAQTWESLSGNVGSMDISSGTTRYIRLTGDVYMAGNIRVFGTLTLDLNGYVLKRSDHKNYLIGVESGGVCTVKDSNPNTSHYGKPATIHVYNDDFDYLWDYDASYTAATPGAIEIKGGIITGGIGQTGGAIINRGTFNLEGGTLAGNFVYCGPFKVMEGNPAAWVTKIEHPWKFDGQHPDYTFVDVARGALINGCYYETDSEGNPTGYCTIKGEGGAIWSGCGATLNMSGGRICYNYAAYHGAGIYCAGKFNMTDGLIDHNYTLGGYGGGVFVNHIKEFHPDFENGLEPVGEMVMDGGEISSNISWGGSGGGIMVWQEAFLTINNGSFFYNEAHGNSAPRSLGNGGAVYGEKCTLVIKNTDMQRNFSHRFGGAIYLWLSADLTMDEGTCIIKGNKATSGGGIAVAHPDASATIGSGVQIQNDTALVDGGGIFMIGGVLNNNGATIEDCIAGNNGGGVAIWVKSYKTDVTYNMTSGNITNNYAGTSNEEYLVTGVTSDYYRSGGGISIVSDKALEEGQGPNNVLVNLDGGIIQNNKVIGDYGKHGGGLFININTENSTATVNVNAGASFENNETNEFGGGFYLNSGTISVNGGKVNQNIAGINGGGVFIGGETSSITVSNGGEINNNTANQNGGGFYAEGGTVLVEKTSFVDNNIATTGFGGGIYSISGVTVDNSSVSGNTAVTGGGFYVASGSSSSIQTLIRNGSRVDGNNANNGAGAYVESGILKVLDNTTQVNSNTATTSGGGIYMASGTVTYTDATMEGNKALSNDGGGLYLGSGTITVSGTSAAIRGNEAKVHGGGIYVGGGTFNMTGGAIGGTTAQGNKTGADGYGGGIYMDGGTATLSGGHISGNEAVNGFGGGIYMNLGTCTLSGGVMVGGATADYANKARHGGGIHSAGGSITVNGGNVAYNKATDGGGIYSNGPTATVTIIKEGTTPSLLEHNQAVRGGGIFANRGVVDFTDGQVRQNYASEAGGGMYVNTEGTLNLKGNATLSGNHVPATGKGGGVYLAGTVVVGESAKALGTITAQDNYAGASYQYDPTHGLNNRNNIYLPEPVANPYTSSEHRDVITVIENGVGTTSRVGFSVPRNHVPVIYCAYSLTSRAYLKRFKTGPDYDLNMVLFDDTERYLSVHEASNPYFDPDHVYLYGFWPEAVIAEPSAGFTWSGDTLTISTEEGLAWLINYVNGWKGSAGVPHTLEGKVVSLASDLNMEAFGWAPVGFKGREGVPEALFKGEFDGNGHTIEGVNGMVYGNDDEGVYAYGLFGKVEDANIHDVFVKGTKYYLDDNASLVLGGLVGESDGTTTISNSESQSTLVSQSPAAVIGGLVGKLNGGEVHSCIGIADMRGGTMGGLVGEQSAGAILRNSFANARFERHPDATTQYTGGLVAVNRGRVENCYARLRGPEPANFGILVGDNEGGTVNYCYAPVDKTNYTKTGNNPTGHGNYGDTELPYLYRHRDTQVTLAEGQEGNNGHVPAGAGADKQMMKVLNAWVEKENGDLGEARYTPWGRPWQKGDDAKPINDDLPVLRMPIANAVASSQGDPYLDYSDIDRLLNNYHASGDAIWMYASDTLVTGSTGSGELYIAEDVMLVHTGTLDAYVCVTLDNSAGAGGANPTYGAAVGVTTDATDWHLFSTPLMNAPLGIDYGTDGNTPYEFSFGHPDGMPYYRFHQGKRHGYFPSHRYGTDYPATDANLTDADNAGNYYKEWDFYAYSEPDYHWINFKRNSASHHHYDTEGHDPIAYENESKLVRGKGYFVATREETMLQCHDTLNNGAVETTYNLTQTSGVPRHGYNLLGNPYQAYLDFDLFAEANSDDDDAIWADVSDASYTILDEDPVKVNGNDTVVAYRTYSYRATEDNPWVAGRFIHPHQGFFVRLSDNAEATAYFYGDMRNASDTVNSKFRAGERPRYPLVNLVAAESNGMADVVTVELGRPDKGGAPVMRSLRTGNGKLWCSYEGRDYAIAFTQPGVSEAAIRFETVAEAEYTMTWDTHNGEFGYLHLIDNKTGADIDCLTTGEYKFTASPSDYTSRFRLVFDYTGVEEGEGDTPAGPSTFAFMMGDELVVTGEGVLQAFDVTGRMVLSRELRGVQTTVSLPEASSGVYVLRLTNGRESQVQKMVISK